MNSSNDATEKFRREVEFLMAIHDAAPGITENVMGAGRTEDGRSSYEILCDVAEPLYGRAVIDLACGSGCLAELLTARVGASGQVTGVDLNPAELALAQQRLCGIGQMRFIQESACQLSLPSYSADVVLCHMAFMLFQPVDQAVAEIARILRAGGIFAALMPALNSANALFVRIRSILTAVLEYDVVPDKRLSLGDSAAGSSVGVKNILSRNGGFQDNLRITDFELIFRETPELLAARLFSLFYYTKLLSACGQAELHKEWLAILEKEPRNAAGQVVFRLPLSVFTVTKH